MSPQQCFLHGVCCMVRSCSMGPTAITYMIPHFPIRGLIGPSRQFGPHSIYHAQLYAIILGALLPLPFWIMQRRRPDSWAKFVSTPVVLLGVSYIPPSVGINYSSWFAVGFVFQFIVRKRNFAWWSKYNYVTGAALDCGLYFYVFSLARRRLVTD
jgi:OPT oligopeptide transporter protein